MNKQKNIIFFSFIWHSTFLAITASMLDLNTVFPALVNSLTENTLVFGSLLTIMLGIPLVFNLLFSHFLKKAKSKRNFLLLGIYLRSLSYLGMGIFVYLFASDNPWLTIFSIYLFIFIFSISAGFAGISYNDLIAKSLPDSLDRNKLFTIKQILSSIAAFLGGLVVTYLFAKDLTYPLNYSIGLMIGFVGLVIASIGFWFVKEPIEASNQTNQESFITFFKRIPKILKKDFEFRKFIIVDNLSSFGVMIMPFYMIYAKTQLNVDDYFIGVYLLIILFGKVLSSFFWGFIGKRFNAKRIVGLCIAVGGLIPILAIFLGKTNPYIFGIIFFFVGIIISGRQIGFSPYLLDLTPKEHRLEYLGIRGSLNISIIILPLIAALIIETLGYSITFIIVSIVMLFTSMFQMHYNKKNDLD
ncbi:MFS transporter [Candidatus Izemoplasma sp. B36]|uniref:MFS transporter n=1 Tax=Candidatus Izemoplasma sp. B36 TaxID=3242468 RepID=UPI003558E10A